LKALELGIGDEIAVYKANMIIPQIARNNTRSGNAVIPATCPCCGGDTRIIREGELSETDISRDDSVETLYCINEFCPAKKIKSFSHFVSRNAMNIDGMSEATLEKFIDNGFLENLDDLYKLEKHKEAIVSLEGFGDKSYNKLISAIDESRHTNMSRFIGGLGIPNVGDTTAKLICKHFHDDLDKIMNSTVEDLVDIDGIGEVIAGAIVRYFDNDTNCAIIRRLVDELDFVSEENDTEQVFEGKVFVITGSLEHFTNRDELKDFIEQRGGKVTGSVSAKTSYLINNDVTSGSSKNKKAHSLGIPILSEEDFLKLVERN
jgi:DNA ligase (NAD+)